MARERAKVVVTDLDDTGGKTVAERIGSAGGQAIFLHQDVSLEEYWPDIIEVTERRFGRLDVMVSNAGIGILCRAVEMSSELDTCRNVATDGFTRCRGGRKARPPPAN